MDFKMKSGIAILNCVLKNVLKISLIWNSKMFFETGFLLTFRSFLCKIHYQIEVFIDGLIINFEKNYLKIVFRLSDLKNKFKFYKLLFKYRILYFDVWLLWSSIEEAIRGAG